MRDFRYYRCSGTDAYRFGGERICSNSQIRAEEIEPAVWSYVCQLVKNPGNLVAMAYDEDAPHKVLTEDVDCLKTQRQKLQHGIERLIDTLADGVIDKDQFTSRMDRAKTRLADLDQKITAHAAHEGRREHVRSAMIRLAELSGHLVSQLKGANLAAKRDIIRALVQRIEIGPANIRIVLRLPTETTARGVEPIIVTLSRA